jgi:hypothetical protein
MSACDCEQCSSCGATVGAGCPESTNDERARHEMHASYIPDAPEDSTMRQGSAKVHNGNTPDDK